MAFTIPTYNSLAYGSVFCIGKNYARHIAEMGSKPSAEPVVFLKSRNSIIHSGDEIVLPASSSNVHHEVELVLLIGNKTVNTSPAAALQNVAAYAVGIDVTARDVQAEAKKHGLPWALAKGFRTFAPVGNFIPFTEQTNLQNMDVSVKVNGETRQNSNTSHMLFSCAEIISYLSKKFTLFPGDIIFTGTPEGVSQIHKGDRILASLHAGKSEVEVYVTE